LNGRVAVRIRWASSLGFWNFSLLFRRDGPVGLLWFRWAVGARIPDGPWTKTPPSMCTRL